MEGDTASVLMLGVLCYLQSYGEAGLTLTSSTDVDIGFDIYVSEECYSADGVYTKIPHVPLVRCVLECAIRPKCQAVNHRYTRNTCELLDSDEDSKLQTGQCQFVKKSHMVIGNIPCKDCNLMQACDVVQGECVYKECPMPEIPNARVIGYENSVGSSVRVICHHGYKAVNGAVVAVCLKDGTWSQAPQCVWDDSAGVDPEEPLRGGQIGFDGTHFSPAANCSSVNILATDDWCMFNCNHIPPFCPDMFCECQSLSEY